MRQHGIGLEAPIVEVPGDDDRRAGWQAVQQVEQKPHLALPVSFAQAEVHTHRMHLVMARYLQATVQQPTLLVTVDRDIQVVMLGDGKLGQQGIAMVAVRVHGIASIGELRPHAVGEKLVLGRLWPRRVALGMVLMAAVNLLQEHQVGATGTHRFAQLRQDETPVERGKPLVHVEGQHVQPMHRGYRVDAAAGHGQDLVHGATSGKLARLSLMAVSISGHFELRPGRRGNGSARLISGRQSEARELCRGPRFHRGQRLW